MPLNGVTRRSRTYGSGEVGGVVDFREEAVLLRSFEDEAAEADNRSDCFPDDDGGVTEGGLGFRDIVIEIGGVIDSGRRGAALVSVAFVDTTRLAGSAASRVLGRRGDLEMVFVIGLVSFLTSFVGSASLSPRRKLVPIFGVSESRHTGIFRSLSSSSGS